MNAYADTNFLTRCYLLSDDLTPPHDELERLSLAGGVLPITWLHRVEVPNALELHVFAAKTLGQTRVTPTMAAAARARFENDCSSHSTLLRQVALEISDVELQFHELSSRHTAKHGFRTYDLLHVSSALLVGADTFWSFDVKANKLATLEGLVCLPAVKRG